MALIRVCGASEERDALSRSQCWCRGLFCGRGGGKRTMEFRRDVRRTAIVRSVAQFEDLISQPDLYDGEAMREKRLGRLSPRKVSAHGTRRARSNS